MPNVDVNKILVVLVFLAVLVCIQIVLKRSSFVKSNLGKPVHWPLKVTNTLSLSKFSTVSVIECAEQSFLVVAGRSGSPAIIELKGAIQDTVSPNLSVELND